jgi:hypothetical protein
LRRVGGEEVRRCGVVEVRRLVGGGEEVRRLRRGGSKECEVLRRGGSKEVRH